MELSSLDIRSQGTAQIRGLIALPCRLKNFVNYQGTGSARDRLQIPKSSPLPVQIRDNPTSEPKSHECSQNLTGASGKVNCACKWKLKTPTPSQMNRA
jgi:hypothetical protein